MSARPGPWEVYARFTRWGVRRRITNGYQQHVGRSIRVGGPGRIILFGSEAAAQARAVELNQAEAENRRRRRARAVAGSPCGCEFDAQASEPKHVSEFCTEHNPKAHTAPVPARVD